MIHDMLSLYDINFSLSARNLQTPFLWISIEHLDVMLWMRVGTVCIAPFLVQGC